WVVYDKKGTKYTFGSAASSRQDNPLDSTKIYKWMLQEVRDTNNNYIAFNYYKDTGQIYPSSVVYTGNGTIGGIFEIDFLRQSRTDTSSSYKTGFLVKTNYRINEIDILVNLSWVKKYILSYATGRNGYNSLLQNITESGRDDLLNIATLPPTQFGYQNTTNPTWTENTSWTIPLNFVENGTCQKDNAVRVFDANGDGLPDIVQSYYDVYLGTTTHVYLNTGSGWTENTSWIVPVSFIQYNGTGCGVDLGVRIFDANGDGIMDLVQAAQVGDTSGVPIYAKHVYLGTGNGWVENSAWTAGIPTIFSNIDTRVPQNWDFQLVDVNGDGMIDWVESAQVGDISGVPIYEKHVYLNTGSGWSESAAWSSAIPVNFVENGSCQKEMGVRMFDVNGDGLADIVQSYFDVYSQIWTKHVYLNTGSTWVEDATWTASLPVHFMDYITCPGKDSGVRIFDANGDGLPDLVQAVQTGDTSGVPIYEKHVYLNTGNGWREDTAWRIPTIFVNNDSTRPQIWNFQTQDINGDGRVDLLESAQVGDISGVPLYEKHLFLGTGVQDDMLSQIIYNQGGTTSVIYKETPLYRTGSNTIANPNLPFELPAVYQIFNNSGSVTQTTTYQYDGGKYYYNTYLDRRLGGFADIVTTDSANNTKKNFYHTGTGTDASRGQYNDNGYKIDKIYRTEIANSTGTIYSKTINKWNDFDLGSGRRFVKLDQKLDLTYDGLATHKDKAEAYTYDNATGNILTKIEYGQVNGNDDGTFTDVGTDDFTTTYAYASNVSAFIVGLVDDVTVNDRSLNKIKEDRYYYDLQTLGGVTKGNQTKREMWKTGTTYVN
ncbi:MAG TPA: toxin TcdB middle/N-terminal domain-containing protein, partial [Patescibacteria group bacterium]